MKIVITNNQEFNPQIGGIERVSDLLAREWIKSGNKVYFIAAKKSVYSKEYELASEQLISDRMDLIKDFTKERNVDLVLNQAGNDTNWVEMWSEICDDYNIRLITAIH